MALTFSLNIKNFFHASDLHDLHLASNALLRSRAFLLGALQIVIGKHSGIAAGADLIGDVHGLSPLDEATFLIALWLRLLKCADAISSQSRANHHDDLQYNIEHIPTPYC
jgi:hypothetical protein